MQSKTSVRVVMVGMAAGFAAVFADLIYCVGANMGRKTSKASEPMDTDPSPEETGEVEPDESSSHTESDED